MFSLLPSSSHPFSSVSWELLPLYAAAVEYFKGHSIVLCTQWPLETSLYCAPDKNQTELNTLKYKIYFNNVGNVFFLFWEKMCRQKACFLIVENHDPVSLLLRQQAEMCAIGSRDPHNNSYWLCYNTLLVNGGQKMLEPVAIETLCFYWKPGLGGPTVAASVTECIKCVFVFEWGRRRGPFVNVRLLWWWRRWLDWPYSKLCEHSGYRQTLTNTLG